MTNDPLIGQTLDGRYRIVELLGRGGMAIVYRAVQPAMDREVAIKVILPEVASGEEFIQRFKHEARIVARLEHPHILPVYDFGEYNGQAYLVMRLLTTGDLQSRLMQGALPPEEVSRIVSQIASALTHAHERGVVHRDLKPQNVLMDASGNTYLTDFGIAKAAGSSAQMTATGTIMGTPSYMAPEQWRSESVDARTDIYALGIMAYVMLSGELPYESDTPFGLMYKHFESLPAPLEERNSRLSPALTTVVFKAIAKDPDDRYPSAIEFAKALDAAIQGRPFARKEEERPSTLIVGTDEYGTLMSEDSELATMVKTMDFQPPAKQPSVEVPPAAAVPVPRRSRIPLFVVLGVIAALIVGGLIFMLMSGDDDGEVETPSEARGQVIVGRGLLYSEPATTSEELSTVPEGANLRVLATVPGERWYQVDFDGLVGWILADQIELSGNLETITLLEPTATPEPSPTPAVATPVACELTTFATGNARTVNILASPNAGSEVVAEANTGEILTASARTEDGWYLTPQGWIFQSVVDISSPFICGGLPLIDPALNAEDIEENSPLCEVVSAAELELRQGAGFGTTSITIIPASTQLSVYEVARDETGRVWYRTVYADAPVFEGWILAEAAGAVAGSCPDAPEAVIFAGDPYSNPLGLTQTPAFVETFDSDVQRWTSMLDSEDELVIEDGLLRFTKKGRGFQVIISEAEELGDFIDDAYFSMQVTVPPGFSEAYSFEFIFRNFYTVRITESGSVAVSLEADPSFILGSTEDGVANLSEGITLGVHLDGAMFTIYVNGQSVLEAEDDRTAEGLLPRFRIGNRSEDEDLTVLIDNFIYLDLSQ